MRGVARGRRAAAGATIEIPTGGVVVGIYADSPRLAAAAAQTVVPINEAGAPGAPLPARAARHRLRLDAAALAGPSPLRALR